jgi:hypothetical protein
MDFEILKFQVAQILTWTHFFDDSKKKGVLYVVTKGNAFVRQAPLIQHKIKVNALLFRHMYESKSTSLGTSSTSYRNFVRPCFYFTYQWDTISQRRRPLKFELAWLIQIQEGYPNIIKFIWDKPAAKNTPI